MSSTSKRMTVLPSSRPPRRSSRTARTSSSSTWTARKRRRPRGPSRTCGRSSNTPTAAGLSSPPIPASSREPAWASTAESTRWSTASNSTPMRSRRWLARRCSSSARWRSSVRGLPFRRPRRSLVSSATRGRSASPDDGSERSRASAWPTAPASGSRRGRISAADPSGPTTSRGRSNRSSRRDSSRGRPSPPRPYAAENSSTTPTRVESSRGAPRTSSSSMEIRSQIRPPCGGCGAWRGSQIPEWARESGRTEVGRQLLLRWPDIVELRSVAVEGHAQRVRLVDRQRHAVVHGILALPIVQVGPTAEEDHVVRTGVHDVVPPTRRGDGEIDDRLPRRGDGAAVRQGEHNRLRAIVALRRDPDLLVQHRMEGHGVPRAVREVPPSIPPRDEERSGAGGERPGPEDPLGPWHQPHVAAILEGLQHLECLRAAETELFHDLLRHRRDGVFQEVIEDVLSHVLHEVVRTQHDRAQLRMQG